LPLMFTKALSVVLMGTVLYYGVYYLKVRKEVTTLPPLQNSSKASRKYKPGFFCFFS
jgi:hypothetical protein